MKFKICGEETPDSDAYCHNCGNPIAKDESVESGKTYEQTIIQEDPFDFSGTNNTDNSNNTHSSDIKYCHNCGKPLDPSSQYCMNCGVRTDGESKYQPKSVGFMDSFGLYWKNYFKFKGRASRSEFWYAVLWLLIIDVASSILQNVSGFSAWREAKAFNFLYGDVLGYVDVPEITSFMLITAIIVGLWGLVSLIPKLSLAIRRLHDIGKSGWWALLYFVPYVGEAILLIILIAQSQPTRNQYDE